MKTGQPPSPRVAAILDALRQARSFGRLGRDDLALQRIAGEHGVGVQLVQQLAERHGLMGRLSEEASYASRNPRSGGSRFVSMPSGIFGAPVGRPEDPHRSIGSPAPIDLASASDAPRAEAQELAGFVEAYAVAYHDPSHRLFDLIPLLRLSTAAFSQNPDPQIFGCSRDGQAWINRNPSLDNYTYSASREAYVRSGPARPEDVFFDEVAPKFASNTALFDPSIEERIAELEAAMRGSIAKSGLRSVPAFALRGISCSSLAANSDEEASLNGWRKRGYLSEAGGNFFVFGSSSAIPLPLSGAGGPDPVSTTPKTADQLLARLMASSAATFRYASRAEAPIIIVAAMGPGFWVPPSGGNDGIDGSYPTSFHFGSESFHMPNLEVGCITRPGAAAREVGLSAHGVPEDRILELIGASGLPDWATPVGGLDGRGAAELNALYRWVYLQVLESIAEELTNRRRPAEAALG